MSKKSALDSLILMYENAYENALKLLCDISLDNQPAGIVDEIHRVNDLLYDMIVIFYKVGGVNV